MATPIVTPGGVSSRASRATPTQHDVGAHNALPLALSHLSRGKVAAGTGLHLVHLEHSTLLGEVEAGDLLHVDFSQHRVTREGLYLVHLGAWTGVRRFMDALRGVWALEADGWQPVPSTMRILGYVDAVYTPCNDQEGVCHG